MRDLNLLYVFEAIWLERSVTLAADRLGVSQAAVSASLKRLRLEYDDHLFSLVGRRMEPTTKAIETAPQMLQALSMVRSTHVESRPFDPATARRNFTLRTRDIGEVVCLPQIFSALHAEAPGVGLRTVFKPIPETIAGLAYGEIDFALGFLPSLETSIHSRPLFSQRYVCVMREGHALGEAPLTVEAFCAGDHLLVEYSGSGHLLLERALKRAGAGRRIRLSLPQYLSAPHFVVENDLLWSVPEILAERLATLYPLQIRPHPLALPPFEISLYWHDRFHKDPANQWMRNFIVGRLKGVAQVGDDS